MGEAIARHGGTASVQRLIRNSGAELSKTTLARLTQRARSDELLAAELRERQDIDWAVVRGQVEEVGRQVLGRAAAETPLQAANAVDKVTNLVVNRLRSRAGFSSKEWGLAYNQVKALFDRNQLDDRAITRFARFGYGHHSAASIALKLGLQPDQVIRWLAVQDYDAVTVALKAMRLQPGLLDPLLRSLPWRDVPDSRAISWSVSRFETLDEASVADVVQVWRGDGARAQHA